MNIILITIHICPIYELYPRIIGQRIFFNFYYFYLGARTMNVLFFDIYLLSFNKILIINVLVIFDLCH